MKSKQLLDNIINQLGKVQVENIEVICDGIQIGDVYFLYAGEDQIDIAATGIDQHITCQNLANIVKAREKQRKALMQEINAQGDFSYVLGVLKHHS